MLPADAMLEYFLGELAKRVGDSFRAFRVQELGNPNHAASRLRLAQERRPRIGWLVFVAVQHDWKFLIWFKEQRH